MVLFALPARKAERLCLSLRGVVSHSGGQLLSFPALSFPFCEARGRLSPTKSIAVVTPVFTKASGGDEYPVLGLDLLQGFWKPWQ